ncbi:MAG: DNA primase [Chitinophagales bacterium]|nr:DNA primase [Chitinophagales bacterium]MDW8418812.1 DNA primase [Chitinophagales bacterium]
MIKADTIRRIQDEARVEDIVGEFVTLKKRGANLVGLCPFHNEKTPSFYVSPAKNIYKCFGCSKAGGPVQFLMDYQQMSYPEALRYIAKKYGIEVEEAKLSDEEKLREQEQHQLTESILIANTAAQKFYTDFMLHHEDGKIGLAYFRERGFHTATIEKFQLGYAPDEPDAFTRYALQKGFQLEILKKAGLTSAKENSKLDFFRNRVMFPIHNLTGKVVAFGGRIMVKDEKSPKYINTPESDVYVKSKILYGLYFSKNEIRKRDECLLVEGYTDVISLHQNGIENVVASSGTSLTQEQIRLIKRITNNITLIYDGDVAGVKAALRGTDLILEEGMNVRIVVLPHPEDPDSYIRKTGSEKFLQYIREHKRDLITFKTSLLADEARQDPIRKAQLIREILESIARIPDAIQRSVYVKQCSERFDMSEQILITEVNKLRRKLIKESADARRQTEANIPVQDAEEQKILTGIHHEQVQELPNRTEILEREVIRILMEYGTRTLVQGDTSITVAEYVFESFEDNDLQTPYLQKVFAYIRNECKHGNIPDEKHFLQHDDPDIASLAVELLAFPYSASENWWYKFQIPVPEKQHAFAQDVQSVINHYWRHITTESIKKINEKIKEAVDSGNEEVLANLLQYHRLLTQQKKELSKGSGTVI